MSFESCWEKRNIQKFSSEGREKTVGIWTVTTGMNIGNRLPSCVCRHERTFWFIPVCWNCLPNLTDFGYNISNLRKHKSFSWNIQVDRSRFACSTNLYSLRSGNWLIDQLACLFSSVYFCIRYPLPSISGHYSHTLHANDVPHMRIGSYLLISVTN